MELGKLLQEVSAFQKQVASVTRLLREISRLEPEPSANLPQLKSKLRTLDKKASQLGQSQKLGGDLSDWAARYRQGLRDLEQEVKSRFGSELDEQLRKIGLGLEGQYPLLKAGLFTIELDFEQLQAVIWYGPKQERLAQCRLEASIVAGCVEHAREHLGSGWTLEEFLTRLQKACWRTAARAEGEPVPIVEALAELAYLRQSPRFRQDPRREHFTSYSRADFSYDLFGTRQAEPQALLDRGMHLVVATRVHTRKRSGFLWVPDDERGKGTTYSHLRLEEVNHEGP